MTSRELIALLDRICLDPKSTGGDRKYARLLITEILEDELDRGGPFTLPAPAREYASELLPPPHVEWDRLPDDR